MCIVLATPVLELVRACAACTTHPCTFANYQPSGFKEVPLILRLNKNPCMTAVVLLHVC